MFINQKLLRTIAAGLVVAFFCQEAAWALPAGSFSNPLSSQTVLASNPMLFEPPLDFAELKELHQGGAGKLIIHIQDAHSNLSGQQNLAAALDQLMSKYDVSLVLVEGAAGDATLTPVKQMLSPEACKKVAKSLLMEGQIAGEEYLNLVSEHPMKIVGAEDLALYFKSVTHYASLADRRERVLRYLGLIQEALSKLKKKSYPEKLLLYEAKKAQPDPTGKDDLEKSFAQLLKLAETAKTDLSNFPHIQKLAALQQNEGQIDFDLANMEQAALLEEISRRGGKEDLEEHFKKMRLLRNARASQYAFFQNTFKIAQEKNIVLSAYPSLVSYEKYLRDFVSIDFEKILEEWSVLEDKVYASLLADEDSRRVRAIDRYLSLLAVAYRIQMTTKDFKFFQANEPDFGTAATLAFMNRKLAENGYLESLVPYKPLLEEGRRSLAEFYDSVDRRDRVFIESAENALAQENQQVAVLITGGYHTSHLKKLFREKGYSYAVLTPFVTSETNQAKYEKLLLSPVRRETKKIETIQGESKTRGAPPADLKKGLLRAAKKDGVIVLKAAMGARVAVETAFEKEASPENAARIQKWFAAGRARWETAITEPSPASTGARLATSRFVQGVAVLALAISFVACGTPENGSSTAPEPSAPTAPVSSPAKTRYNLANPASRQIFANLQGLFASFEADLKRPQDAAALETAYLNFYSRLYALLPANFSSGIDREFLLKRLTGGGGGEDPSAKIRQYNEAVQAFNKKYGAARTFRSQKERDDFEAEVNKERARLDESKKGLESSAPAARGPFAGEEDIKKLFNAVADYLRSLGIGIIYGGWTRYSVTAGGVERTLFYYSLGKGAVAFEVVDRGPLDVPRVRMLMGRPSLEGAEGSEKGVTINGVPVILEDRVQYFIGVIQKWLRDASTRKVLDAVRGHSFWNAYLKGVPDPLDSSAIYRFNGPDLKDAVEFSMLKLYESETDEGVRQDVLNGIARHEEQHKNNYGKSLNEKHDEINARVEALLAAPRSTLRSLLSQVQSPAAGAEIGFVADHELYKKIIELISLDPAAYGFDVRPVAGEIRISVSHQITAQLHLLAKNPDALRRLVEALRQQPGFGVRLAAGRVVIEKAAVAGWARVEPFLGGGAAGSRAAMAPTRLEVNRIRENPEILTQEPELATSENFDDILRIAAERDWSALKAIPFFLKIDATLATAERLKPILQLFKHSYAEASTLALETALSFIRTANSPEEMAEVVLDFYRNDPQAMNLSKIDLNFSGLAIANHRHFIRTLFELLSVSGRTKDYSRPAGLPSRERPTQAKAFDQKDVEIDGERLDLTRPAKIYGRTLVYHGSQGKAYAFKFLKKDEPPLLYYEHDMLNFLRSKKEEWELRGDYPEGKIDLATVPVGSVPGLAQRVLEANGAIELSEGEYRSEAAERVHTFMVYEFDAIAEAEAYFTYLNDADLSETEFEEAFEKNIHDAMVLARHGLFNLESIELFHARADKGGSSEDNRRYNWMIDVALDSHTGAGRVNDYIGATLYPNFRLSGLADFAQLEHVVDIADRAKKLFDLSRDNPYDSAYVIDDERIRLLLDRTNGDATEVIPYLQAVFMGDTVLSLGLMPPTYLLRKGQLDYDTESEQPDTLLKRALRKLSDLSYQTYTDNLKTPYSGYLQPDVDLTSRQMAYTMTGRYRRDYDSRLPIPADLYPGAHISSIGPAKGWRENGWNLQGLTHSIPSRSPEKRIQMQSADLGPFNGPSPLQALTEGLYITTALSVFDAVAGARASTVAVDESDAWTPWWQQGHPTSNRRGAYQGRYKEFFVEFFQKLKREKPRARILDLATGNFGVPFIAKEVSPGFALAGIDKADVRPENIPGAESIEFRRGSIDETGFEAGSFDAVTSAFGFEYADEDRPKAVKEINRLLPVGGEGAFLIHHRNSFNAYSARTLLEHAEGVYETRIFEVVEAYLRDPSTANQAKLDTALAALEASGEQLFHTTADVIYRLAYEPTAQAALEGLKKHEREFADEVLRLKDLARVAMSRDDIENLRKLFIINGFSAEYKESYDGDDGLIGWEFKFTKRRDLRPASAGVRMASERSRAILLGADLYLEHLKNPDYLRYFDHAVAGEALSPEGIAAALDPTVGARFAQVTLDPAMRERIEEWFADKRVGIGRVVGSRFAASTNSNMFLEERLALSDSTRVNGQARSNFIEAVNYIAENVNESPKPTLNDLREIHKILMNHLAGGGWLSDSTFGGIIRGTDPSLQAFGALNYGPSEKVPEELRLFFEWYEEEYSRASDVFLFAAEVYQRLIKIHPFYEGNGRAIRLFVDWVLEGKGYSPVRYSKEYRYVIDADLRDMDVTSLRDEIFRNVVPLEGSDGSQNDASARMVAARIARGADSRQEWIERLKRLAPSAALPETLAEEPEQRRRAKEIKRNTTPPHQRFTTHDTVETIHKLLVSLNRTMPGLEIALYGSYADERQDRWSDLDISFTKSIAPHLKNIRNIDRFLRQSLEANGYTFDKKEDELVSLYVLPISREMILLNRLMGKFFTENKFVWFITSGRISRLDLDTGEEVDWTPMSAKFPRKLENGVRLAEATRYEQAIMENAEASKTLAGARMSIPDPLEVFQSNSLRHMSYLDRRQPLWAWLSKRGYLAKIIAQAKKKAKDPSSPVLTLVSMGASTGEDLAGAFHEIVNWLTSHGETIARTPDEPGWRIRIHGLEESPVIAETARNRILGKERFETAVLARKPSVAKRNRQYAAEIVKTLNQNYDIFKSSVLIHVMDASSPQIFDVFKDPDIVLATSVFQYFEVPAAEVQQKMDENWPNATFLMTLRNVEYFEQRKAVHHAVISVGRRLSPHYLVAIPKSFRKAGKSATGTRLAEQLTQEQMIDQLVGIAKKHEDDDRYATYNLVIGAGVSGDVIPTWYALRDLIAAQILSWMERHGLGKDEAERALAGFRDNWRISPERTMRLYSHILGLKILDIFNFMVSAKPTKNHRAIADIMLSPYGAKRVISLNFDTLIENALYEKGVWRIRPLDPRAGDKIDRIEVAQYDANTGRIIESTIQAISFSDVKDGRATVRVGNDLSEVRLFYVNDETSDDYGLAVEQYTRLIGQGVPVLDKIHGSAEIGREYTIVADFEGTFVFPKKQEDRLLDAMRQGRSVFLGISGGDPDFSSEIAFLAAVLEKVNKLRAGQPETLNEREAKVAQKIQEGQPVQKEGAGISMVGNRSLRPTQANLLKEPGSNYSLNGGSFLVEFAQALSALEPAVPAEPIASVETVQKTPQEIRGEMMDHVLGEIFERPGRRPNSKEKDAVYAVALSAQEADPQGRNEARVLAGISADDADKIQPDAALIERVAKERRVFYRSLLKRGLITRVHYWHLMANHFRDNQDYEKAYFYYHKIATRPLKTDIAVKDDAEGRQKFMDVWQQHRVKLLAVVEMNDLRAKGAWQASVRPLSRQSILDIMNTMTELNVLFDRVFDLQEGFSKEEVSSARRMMARLKATSYQLIDYLGAMTRHPGKLDKEFFDDVIGALEGTVAWGGDLNFLIDVQLAAFVLFTRNRQLDIAKGYMDKLAKLIELHNLLDYDFRVVEFQTIQAYYFLLDYQRNRRQESLDEMMKLVQNRKLIDALAERPDKNWWLRITKHMARGLLARNAYTFKGERPGQGAMDGSADAARYDALMNGAIDWFLASKKRLNNREVEAVFYLLMMLFDEKYLNGDYKNYRAHLPEVARKYFRQFRRVMKNPETFGRGFGQISEMIRDTSLGFSQHIKAVERLKVPAVSSRYPANIEKKHAASREAYDSAAASYRRAIAYYEAAAERAAADAQTNEPEIENGLTQVFLLAQLNVDMAEAEANLIQALKSAQRWPSTERQRQALALHERSFEEYMKTAAELLERIMKDKTIRQSELASANGRFNKKMVWLRDKWRELKQLEIQFGLTGQTGQKTAGARAATLQAGESQEAASLESIRDFLQRTAGVRFAMDKDAAARFTFFDDEGLLRTPYGIAVLSDVQYAANLQRKLLDKLNEMLGPVKAGVVHRILSVGAGRGFFESILLSERPDVEMVAVDINEKNVRMAEEFFSRTTLKDRFRAFVGDAHRLRADLEKAGIEPGFDAVLMVDVIGYIDPEKALLSASEVLKAQGALIITSVSHQEEPDEAAAMHFSAEQIEEIRRLFEKLSVEPRLLIAESIVKSPSASGREEAVAVTGNNPPADKELMAALQKARFQIEANEAPAAGALFERVPVNYSVGYHDNDEVQSAHVEGDVLFVAAKLNSTAELGEIRLALSFGAPEARELASTENLTADDLETLFMLVASRSLDGEKEDGDFAFEFKNGFAILSQAEGESNTVVFRKKDLLGNVGEEIGRVTVSDDERRRGVEALRQKALDRSALGARSVEDFAVSAAFQDYLAQDNLTRKLLSAAFEGLAQDKAVVLYVSVKDQDTALLARQKETFKAQIAALNESSEYQLDVRIRFVDEAGRAAEGLASDDVSDLTQGSRLGRVVIGVLSAASVSFAKSVNGGYVPTESARLSSGSWGAVAYLPILRLAVMASMLEPTDSVYQRVLKTLMRLPSVNSGQARLVQHVPQDATVETYEKEGLVVKLLATLSEILYRKFVTMISTGSSA